MGSPLSCSSIEGPPQVEHVTLQKVHFTTQLRKMSRLRDLYAQLSLPSEASDTAACAGFESGDLWAVVAALQQLHSSTALCKPEPFGQSQGKH